MAPLITSVEMPVEVIEAAKFGRRSGLWIRAKCPFCDPEGRKRPNLAVGERGWLCHACHAEEREHDERQRMRVRLGDPRSAAADERRRREIAMQLWENTSTLQSGDPVDLYLQRRKLVLKGFPVDLRRARLKHPENNRHYTAMVAAVRDVAGGLVAVHRTFLLDDGTRADGKTVPRQLQVENAKLSLGPLGGGAAIRLGSDPNADSIGVAEGIESALGFAMRLQLPCWSTVSADGMKSLRIPKDVRRVLIGPDIGDPGNAKTGYGKHAGMKAAVALRERLLAEAKRDNRRLVVELKPPPLGDRGDWADWAKHAASL